MTAEERAEALGDLILDVAEASWKRDRPGYLAALMELGSALAQAFRDCENEAKQAEQLPATGAQSSVEYNQ